MNKIKIAEKRKLTKDAFDKIENLFELLDSNIFIKNFRLTTPDTCYTNFKDAIFHFNKMISLNDEASMFDQYYALNEHVTRARTDYYLSVFYPFSYALESLLKNETIDKFKTDIRDALHDMKSCIFEIRYSGMQISSSYNRLDDSDMQDSVNKTLAVISKLGKEKEFMQLLHEYIH